MLREVARMFREEPQKIEQNRAALMARLAASARPQGRVTIGAAELDNAARQLGGMIDPVNGGTARRAEIPAGRDVRVSLAGRRCAPARTRFSQRSKSRSTHICEGGIYDHLGGGFSRYSVDERWLVPHFEKMLYDNAQLLELLAARAISAPASALFAQRARETVEWLKREMTTRGGRVLRFARRRFRRRGRQVLCLVAATRSCDVLGVEDAEFFARHYDVTPAGNFEGHNILNRLNAAAAQRRRRRAARGAAPETVSASRDARIRPGLDDKMLADWNGLMIAALVNAGPMLDEPSWLDIGRARLRCSSTPSMTRGDRLGHSWRDGQASMFPGLASDYAAMIRAALALHEATGRRGYLERRSPGRRALDRHYAIAETGGYFLTANDAEGLVVRPAATADEATPNPNARRRAKPGPVGAFSPATETPGAKQADKLFAGLAPLATENLFMHVALLNARRPAPARRGNRGDRRRRRRRGDLLAAALELPAPRSHRAARPFAGKLAGRTPGAGESQGGVGSSRPSSAWAKPARCR